MAQDSQTSKNVGWLEASGLLHISRTLGMAVHPAKLGIALVAIIATLALGWVLDRAWMARERGVAQEAISHFILTRQLDEPYEEPKGEVGVFKVWREHERQCVMGLFTSVIPGASLASAWSNVVGMGYGVWWLFRYHVVYFVLFALGALLIWSLGGGAICRIAAVQFARDEKLTIKPALLFGKQKLFDGFFLAPCIPLLFILITAIALVVGGMVLRIPIAGDLICGLAFGLALFGGFVITVLLLGLLVGGSLFWPAVAVEGSDAFDSFSRGLSYPLSKPLRAIWYGFVTIIFAAVCWLFVNVFTFFMLTITRAVVSFGTSPFGWWSRGDEGEVISKLSLLWPAAAGSSPTALAAWPDWQGLYWHEYFSGLLIGLSVLLVIGLMWSFLVSFYFSGSTVIYCLLRRDVDGTDLEDVYLEEEKELEPSGAPAVEAPKPETPSEPAKEVSLPVVEEAAPAPAPAPSPEPEPSQPSVAAAEPPAAPEPGPPRTPEESGSDS